MKKKIVLHMELLLDDSDERFEFDASDSDDVDSETELALDEVVKKVKDGFNGFRDDGEYRSYSFYLTEVEE
jgi:hypothetical protein